MATKRTEPPVDDLEQDHGGLPDGGSQVLPDPDEEDRVIPNPLTGGPTDFSTQGDDVPRGTPLSDGVFAQQEFQDAPTVGAGSRADTGAGDRERGSRMADSREAQEYLDMDVDFEERGNLDTTHIPPLPGMVQWWVRSRLGNDDDVTNLQRMMNQGWRPRTADTVPRGVFVNKQKMTDFGDVIGFRGMVLMHRPKELHERHARSIAQRARDMKKSVDAHLMRVHKPGTGMEAPQVTRTSHLVVGRRPNVQD